MMGPAGDRQFFLGKAPFAFDEGSWPVATASHRISKITPDFTMTYGRFRSFGLDRGAADQAYLG